MSALPPKADTEALELRPEISKCSRNLRLEFIERVCGQRPVSERYLARDGPHGRPHWIGTTTPLLSEHFCSDSGTSQVILLHSYATPTNSDLVDSPDEVLREAM
jgi:hypothetical protein